MCKKITGVEDGGGVALGEDEAVAGGVLGGRHLVAHRVEKQRGHDLGDRGA